MFGWELPPYNSGGLGTACLGMTEGLVPLGIEVDFVVPQVFGSFPFNHMNILSAADYVSGQEIKRVLKIGQAAQESIVHSIGYGNQVHVDQKQRMSITGPSGTIPVSPHQQATWYAYQATAIAQQQIFEVIHCHDWMTYYAGIAARKEAALQGEMVPFIAHVHATEMDRCGECGDPAIIAIEKSGLEQADHVIAVSEYTRQSVHRHYGIPLNKISVVYNGIRSQAEPKKYDLHELKKHYKLVLFMGRVTMQKGPDYFIKLAKAVTDQDPTVKFMMVGSGDMEKRCVEEAARIGLTGKILFSSFLRGEDVNRAYQMADLFVMPSFSEPFGIVALEALQNGTPVIVSKQSGVAEATNGLVKVDFWDVDSMQQAVLSLLHDHKKAQALIAQGRSDLKHLTWHDSAENLQHVYKKVLQSLILAPLQLAPVI